MERFGAEQKKERTGNQTQGDSLPLLFLLACPGHHEKSHGAPEAKHGSYTSARLRVAIMPSLAFLTTYSGHCME